MSPGPPGPPVVVTTRQPRITSMRGFYIIAGIVVIILFIGLGAYFSAQQRVTSQRSAAQQERKSAQPDAGRQVLHDIPRDYKGTFAPAPPPDQPGPGRSTEPALDPSKPQPPEAVPVGSQPKPSAQRAQPTGTASTTAPGSGGLDPSKPQGTPDGGPGKRTGAQTGTARGQGQEKQKRTYWDLGDVSAKTVKSPHGVHGPGDEEDKRGANLLQEANWMQPANRHKVLYRTQTITVQSLVKMSSEVPKSQFRAVVTQDVWDRWFQQVLIPHTSIMVGETQGAAPSYGDARLQANVQEIHFPDGTVLDFTGANLADRSGQAALPGDVDNHYPQLAFGILLSTALSVGARTAAGSSPYAYQENLAQQYAGGVAQGANQAGQRLTNRFLNLPPTITVAIGEEGTVTPMKNIDLSTVPRTIRPRQLKGD